MIRKLSVMMAVALAGTLLAGASAAAGATAARQPVPGTSDLFAIACTSASACLAVGDAPSASEGIEGVIVPIINGRPGTPQVVPGSNQLLGIACATATSCLAVGSGNQTLVGVLVPITRGTAGSLEVAPSGAGPLSAVACESATTCVVVGSPPPGTSGSLVLTVKNGVPGTARISAGTGLGGVTCPSATECMAVGNAESSSEGVVVPIINGKPGGYRTMSDTVGYRMNGIACATPIECDAVGSDTGGVVGAVPGIVVPVTNGSPGTAHFVPKYQLYAVACVDTHTCLAGGTGGNVTVPITNGVTGKPAGTPGTGEYFLEGIDCATATSCWAAGTDASATASQGAVTDVIVPPLGYVALGDSYSSGEGAPDPNFLPGTDLKNNRCHRSPGAWAERTSSDLANSYPYFTFRACSGATIQDFFHSNPANAGEPPQLSWLNSHAAVVTLTVGGNNVDFATVLGYCALRGAKGELCRNKFNATVNSDISAIASARVTGDSTLAALYAQVKRDAPNARVFIVGYPRLFPVSPPKSCGTGAFNYKFVRSDMLWFNSEGTKLDAAIGAAAKRAGFTYVNTYNAFQGHELCTKDRYLNRAIVDIRKSVQDWSFHPNLAGQRALAAIVEKALA